MLSVVGCCSLGVSEGSSCGDCGVSVNPEAWQISGKFWYLNRFVWVNPFPFLPPDVPAGAVGALRGA